LEVDIVEFVVSKKRMKRAFEIIDTFDINAFCLIDNIRSKLTICN